MKKYLTILVFFVLFTDIFLAGAAFSSTEQEEISQGIELFHSGLFSESYQVLIKAFEHSPGSLELNFYLGRAAFETQNYEMAIMAFERILIASPSESRVKLEMARTFQKLGANDIARQYCHEVLMTHPPEAVKENIKKFLIYMDKTEQNHFLSGSLALGVDWNNNIWSSPSTGNIKTIIGDISLTGPSSKKTQDWVYNTILSADHTYRFSYSKNLWKTQMNLYKAVYDETKALDLRYFGLATGPEILLDKNRLGFRGLINQIELGDDQYMDSIGLKASWDHIFNPGLLSHALFKYEAKNYPDLPDKDAENFSISGDMVFLKNGIWFDLGLIAEKENAFKDDVTYTRYGSTLSMMKKLPFEINTALKYEYQFTKYKSPNALFTQTREDKLHLIGCTLNKKIWQFKKTNQYMTLNLNYQHRWAFSNIELYEYTMDLVQLSLIYNF
ncbi:MAG: DUF560 domain-containing protein [Proteobacteria bacterium]|nr:DUF560 domain-containing protein [Pseudomonadota bacterium]MBU1386999.1 DUF560 domain-containing protein [Pseudomonadota bacterium]MBU1542320.1 DUF560 domain-containing protein [Pseudomonadota bacterium]MBU2481783.1 DUF560 domain-containing protein [Pseudomonadota bacterium]